jgi:hypothetical protein
MKQRMLFAVAIAGSIAASLLFGGGPWPPF